MRFLIMGLSLFTFLAVAPASQAADTEKRAKIIEMIEVSGSANVLDEATQLLIPDILKQIQQRDARLTQEHANELAKVMVQEMQKSKGSFIAQLVPLYEKAFTIEEIEHSIEYYKSPLGQSIMKKMPQLLQSSIQIGQVWGKEVTNRIAQRAVEHAQKLGYKI